MSGRLLIYTIEKNNIGDIIINAPLKIFLNILIGA
jgi:hypothetical protein